MVVAHKRRLSEDYLNEREDRLQNPLPRKKRVRVKKLKVLFYVGVFFSLGISLTLLTAVQAVKGNEINQLKEEIEDIRVSNERLYREKTQLESLSRIEKIATTELGMVKPKVEKIEILTGESAEKINEIFNEPKESDKKDIGRIEKATAKETSNKNPYIEIISNIILGWFSK